MNFPLQLTKLTFDETSVELFVPDADAVKKAYRNGAISFPYWSQIWPAAMALGQFLLRYPFYTKDKNVVEVGAGLGLPSLLAARNATSVLCTDYMPEAVAIATASAHHLQLSNFTAAVMDWHHLPADLRADVLLLSDINYEPDAFAVLQKLIASLLQNGTTILLSTPQRLMAKEFIALLLVDCIQQEEIVVMHDGKDVQVTVLVLERENLFK